MATRYAKVGGAHIAYDTFGDGPTDLLLFMGEYLPVDAFEEEPRLSRAMRRLSSLGRAILFNRRGVGLSDPPDGPPTQDQCVEDALAVLDDLGSERAVPFGWNIGGPAAMLFAAQRPDRTAALVLINTAARLLSAPDYPTAYTEAAFDRLADDTTSVQPTSSFDFLRTFAPSVADDERFRTWWERAGHRGAPPTRSREFWRLLMHTDVRDVLPRIAAPTLVVSSREGMNDLCRYIANNTARARYVQLPGEDLMWWTDACDVVLDEVETFLTNAVGVLPRPRRSLQTVVFIDVVDSTEQAAAMGDRRWREVLGSFHDVVRAEISRAGGRHIGTEGDGILATFSMPADAIRCATAAAQAVRTLGIDTRAGIHTGEIEIVRDDVAGIGVHIAARVKAAADPGKVFVSRTVIDLVTGSGIEFADRGTHDLRGVPGTWQLYEVVA